MRHAGLLPRLRALGIEATDRGNLPTPVSESIAVGDSSARYAEAVSGVCGALRNRVSEALAAGATPLILGGDHSLAAGTLAGVLDRMPATKVIWFDAHGDLNTPATSPTGNVHGMPLSAALGQTTGVFVGLGWENRALPARHLALIGVRSLDPGERDLIHRLGICVFTMADVDRLGIFDIVNQALRYLNPVRDGLHVSLDLDVVDPAAAPGVGTPVAGGMTVREIHLAMELVARAGVMGSLEAVEVNAFRDHENLTGCLATDLILSAFGQTIL